MINANYINKYKQNIKINFSRHYRFLSKPFFICSPNGFFRCSVCLLKRLFSTVSAAVQRSTSLVWSPHTVKA